MRVFQAPSQPPAGPVPSPGQSPRTAVAPDASAVRRFLLSRSNSAATGAGFRWLMVVCALSIFAIVALIAWHLVLRSQLALPALHDRKNRLPGIITGCMLAFARVAGETARLLSTALGNSFWSASLSSSRQQRLCFARALVADPEVLQMDEPASALDPVSTSKIENLIFQLKLRYTIVIVTHNKQQTARAAGKTDVFLNGRMVGFDSTHKIFTNPSGKRTEDYITGRFR